MEYTQLTSDEQERILADRVRQYEAEHFNHSLNKKLLEASGATDEQTQAAIKASEEAMATLDDAHTNTKAEIQRIRDARPKPTA